MFNFVASPSTDIEKDGQKVRRFVVCVRQNLVFLAIFESVSDDKYFLLPCVNKKRPLPVLLDSGIRLYGFVDIDSAFELELDIVFSFDLYAVDYAKAKGKQVDIIKIDRK